MRSRIAPQVFQSLRSLKEWPLLAPGSKLVGESGRTYLIGGDNWMMPEHMRFAKDVHNERLSFNVKQPRQPGSSEEKAAQVLRRFGKELRMNEIFKGAKFIWQQVDTILPTSKEEPPRMVYELMWKSVFEARTLRMFTRKEVKSIMKSTLLALQEIESKGFVHLDLTTEYLLIPTEKLDQSDPTKCCAKVANTDSISIPSQSHEATDLVASPYYAPELFFGKPVSFPAHIWSWGMIFIHMLESRAAWKNDRAESLYIGGMLETWRTRYNSYANPSDLVLGELVCDFNIDFCEYYADCKMPDYMPFEESGWKEHLRNKGVPDEDICFLDWVLDPNPETRPTSEQIMQTGYLEWNEEDTEEEP